MAVHDLGQEAVSFTGSQAGILTDAVYTKAKIREITPVRVLQALEEGKIVLVAGFQGFSRDTMDVTTLGRGGTDATAVALAAALDASCEIYSDVLGVFTADPRVVRDARKLPRVSYEEMLEMAASGAKVLMLRAVEMARAHGVRIHARSTFSDEPGTWIEEVDVMTLRKPFWRRRPPSPAGTMTGNSFPSFSSDGRSRWSKWPCETRTASMPRSASLSTRPLRLRCATLLRRTGSVRRRTPSRSIVTVAWPTYSMRTRWRVAEVG